MRIIPVIDLLGGQVVHAIQGMREQYQPVRSVLCDSSEPALVARAFREQLGLEELYIADLDAIQAGEQTSHRELIATLAREEGFQVLLDAGVSDELTAQRWLKLGVDKIVIGAETLKSWGALQELPSRLPSEDMIFSLDLRGGKILSRCPELATLEPVAALAQLQASGWQEIILLDLERVGSGKGVDHELVTRIRAEFPQISLILGGGVTGMEELLALKKLGAAGALMATALHRGKLNARQVRLLR